MDINLTLPGLGGPKQPPLPQAPAAPPPPPTQVDASRAVANRGGPTGARATAANIRNEGGGRGLPIAGIQRAMKSLTGQ